MQNAETVLGILRERGRRGLPCDELYRQLFNPQLYLLAYGRIYANHGAMTPGATQETADGMSLEKIGAIIDAMRHERYRFAPARRTYIPKRNGKLRPLGMPTWSDKLVGEVVPLLLEAYEGYPAEPCDQWLLASRSTRVSKQVAFRVGSRRPPCAWPRSSTRWTCTWPPAS
jgi:hypothetical protein